MSFDVVIDTRHDDEPLPLAGPALVRHRQLVRTAATGAMLATLSHVAGLEQLPSTAALQERLSPGTRGVDFPAELAAARIQHVKLLHGAAMTFAACSARVIVAHLTGVSLWDAFEAVGVGVTSAT